MMLWCKVLHLCAFIVAFSPAIVLISTAQITEPSEVSALKDIKNSLIDRMNKLENWRKGDPCTRNWTGVICYNYTMDDGYLHVQELQLLKMRLSGNLSPRLGDLSRMKILDVMWNSISGSIPKEVGQLKSLKLLLLNGNQLTGSLPEEIGYLPNLDRIQIDQNMISGPIPKSFAYLNKTKHFHMNNNSLSGQIPPELSRLPSLVHLLLDNNNLSGTIPPELANLRNILIIQLDNNNFSGSTIPPSFGKIPTLLKLSLRNCSLRGPVPDFSGIPQLGFLDLSWNQLTGLIPSNKLSNNITTIDLSHNQLSGTIPSNFSGLPNLQNLNLDDNQLNGSVPSNIWQNVVLTGNRSLVLNFENNSLTNISSPFSPPANVSVMLYGNPVCNSANQLNIAQYCQPTFIDIPGGTASVNTKCNPCPTDSYYELVPLSPLPCFCAIPVGVGYRLKSPGFSDFRPYYNDFEHYLSSGLELQLYQLKISSFMWEEGPRLKMDLKLFPNNVNIFNASELLRIKGMFTGWLIPDSDIFGPYELLNFSLGYYEPVVPSSSNNLSTGAVVGIVLGAVAFAAILSSVITIIVQRKRSRNLVVSKRRHSRKLTIKVEGLKGFTFDEMAHATDNFNDTTLLGQGGYGKVYKGTLADGTPVAIKRAQQGSLQGSKEFFTEIELLSRLHHRNLVSLLGYCNEEDEQMLVYEFMSNGTLRDLLSERSMGPFDFTTRLSIALGSARGIVYLHTEADPPIFHRDIKSSNILLDGKYTAKVADFGLSRLAPIPEIEGTAPAGHVSTVVKGTPGYLDPEYFLTHKLTDKSDVYSLGVVFLEILTGMHPIYHGKNIVREVAAAYKSGNVSSVIDNRMGSFPVECVGRFASLALSCSKDEMESRPSMVEVVRELELIWQMVHDSSGTALDSAMRDSNSERPRTSTSSTSRSAAAPHFVSSDMFGSDLHSGAMSNLAPR